MADKYPLTHWGLNEITEMEMLTFWWNFHHWLHWKLTKWQLPVQLVMKISSKWQHFHFNDGWQFADSIFPHIFLTDNVCFSIKISVFFQNVQLATSPSQHVCTCHNRTADGLYAKFCTDHFIIIGLLVWQAPAEDHFLSEDQSMTLGY